MLDVNLGQTHGRRLQLFELLMEPKIDEFVIKMLFFQICLLLWNNNAVNAECLPKYGFGLSQSVDPVPVDEDYSFQSDLSECRTSCDNLVGRFCFLIM